MQVTFKDLKKQTVQIEIEPLDTVRPARAPTRRSLPPILPPIR